MKEKGTQGLWEIVIFYDLDGYSEESRFLLNSVQEVDKIVPRLEELEIKGCIFNWSAYPINHYLVTSDGVLKDLDFLFECQEMEE